MSASTSTLPLPALPLPALPLPAPTNDPDQALRDIADYGLAIMPGILSGDTLQYARDALYGAAASDRARGREQRLGLDYAHDDSNQRVANILSRDPVFEDMTFYPLVVDFIKKIIGWPALLGNISANITGPGGGEMRLHADQLFIPEPWSAKPQGLNVGWCLDDFTAANGATHVVPGSHKNNRNPRPGEGQDEAVPVEAPAGSIIVFESRLWHRTGNNSTASERRAGIFAWYHSFIYRTQENWFLSLKPEIRQFATEEMLVLLGYKTQGIGTINGAAPV